MATSKETGSKKRRAALTVDDNQSVKRSTSRAKLEYSEDRPSAKAPPKSTPADWKAQVGTLNDDQVSDYCREYMSHMELLGLDLAALDRSPPEVVELRERFDERTKKYLPASMRG